MGRKEKKTIKRHAKKRERGNKSMCPNNEHSPGNAEKREKIQQQEKANREMGSKKIPTMALWEEWQNLRAFEQGN